MLRSHVPRPHLLAATLYTLVGLTGCSTAAPPRATPEPFAAVSAQADQAYRQGEDLYQQGRLDEALEAFQRARLLSPANDTRIDDMVQRVSAQLTPTATPAPPTATPGAEPSPATRSSATPAAELGDKYFGQVVLTIVPGRDEVPPGMTEFSSQDQIGLYIANLDQRLRLALELRIFESGSERLVVDARSDAFQTVASASPSGSGLTPTPSTTITTNTGAEATRTPGPTQRTLARFLNNFVWYHQGGEPVGSYHAELYAGDVLTHTFDYVVGNTPVVIPTETPLPTSPPRPAEPLPAPPATAPAPAPPQPAPPTVAVAPPAAPPLAAPPASGESRESVVSPPPEPTPRRVSIVDIAGGPAAIAATDATGRVYVADGSGLIWTLDRDRAALRRSFSVSGQPVGLGVDAAAGRLYVAVRSQPTVLVLDSETGQELARVALPGEPGDLQLDPLLGLAFVLTPDRGTIETIDVRAAKVVRTTRGLHQVTGMAVDRDTHTLYACQLDGHLTLIDETSGGISGQLALSDVGLAGVAVGHGHAYAINSPGHELLEADPVTGQVMDLHLQDIEPIAIALGPGTGIAYLLDARSATVIAIDPDNGTELQRAALGDAPLDAPALDRAPLWSRPRLAISEADDERVYVTEPSGGTVALIPPLR